MLGYFEILLTENNALFLRQERPYLSLTDANSEYG
jgi:hypothetical protein